MLLSASFIACNEDNNIVQADPIPVTFIKDESFRSYCSQKFDLDRNGYFSLYEILKAENIDIIGYHEIKSLDGIEIFTELKSLRCHNHDLESLNISKNIKLESFSCDGQEKLKSLDLSKNIKLKSLWLTSIPISSIDLTNNLNIKTIHICGTNINEIDLSKNTKLEFLEVYMNKLETLDITHNPNLHFLRCFSNHLTSLDLSNNLELVYLECSDNMLEYILNIANNKKLQEIYCTHNPKIKYILVWKNFNQSDIHMFERPENVIVTDNLDTEKIKLSITFTHTYNYETMPCKNLKLYIFKVINNESTIEWIYDKHKHCYWNQDNNTVYPMYIFNADNNGKIEQYIDDDSSYKYVYECREYISIIKEDYFETNGQPVNIYKNHELTWY